MKQLVIGTAKVLLYMLLVFYIMVASMLIADPSHRNLFTLISCLSTICTLGLCATIALVWFSIKRITDSILRIIVLFGLFFLYIFYLTLEYSIISTSFNFLSLGFDLFTSLAGFLIIKDLMWEQK